MSRNVRTLSVVVASIILIVGTYIAYEKYTRRSHVVAMVKDTGARLRVALEAQAAGGPNADAESHAAAADAHRNALRKMNTSSFSPLAEAADDYFVTSREILRQQAAIQRARTRLAGSLEGLSAHVKADRGASDWTKAAIRLKEVLDKDSRDYRIATESYASLLQTLPASQAKIAPFVEAETLIDEGTIGSARQRALDAYAATDQNVRQAASLDSYRPRR